MKKHRTLAIIYTNTGLTEKQEKFCRLFLELGNACEAYRRTYDVANMKRGTIERRAKEIVGKPKISARLDYLRAHVAEACGITLNRIISEHCKIAFSDATRLRSGWMTLKDFDSLTDAERACISQIDIKKREIPRANGDTITETMVKIKLYDKQRALEDLAQLLGYNAPQKMEATVSVRPLVVESPDPVTAAILKKIAKQDESDKSI